MRARRIKKRIKKEKFKVLNTVSRRQCCGSGMFIPDPDFTHPGSRISDPRSKKAIKERGEKN
jgi:hypothetical protein